MNKFVVFYESADDMRAKVPEYFPAHRALWEKFRADGTLVMIGPFVNAQDGAMGIFTTREAAEAFVKEDPFVLNGLVRNWYIREWREAIAGP